MNNEIKNEKVQVPNGIEMNDKDYLNSLDHLKKTNLSCANRYFDVLKIKSPKLFRFTKK